MRNAGAACRDNVNVDGYPINRTAVLKKKVRSSPQLKTRIVCDTFLNTVQLAVQPRTVVVWALRLEEDRHNINIGTVHVRPHRAGARTAHFVDAEKFRHYSDHLISLPSHLLTRSLLQELCEELSDWFINHVDKKPMCKLKQTMCLCFEIKRDFPILFVLIASFLLKLHFHFRVISAQSKRVFVFCGLCPLYPQTSSL